MLVERPQPIARQVTKIISERIRGQDYSPGERLPSESDLAEELGVSRATVRSALGKLAAEGLVLRKQGDGTYVNQHIIDVPTRMGAMWDFVRLIENIGYAAATQMLESDIRPATAQESALLRITTGSNVITLKRRFSADGKPVILVNDSFPASLFDDPTKALEQIEGELPLRELLWQKCRQAIAYAIINIKAVLPGEDAIQLLERDDSAPLLKLEQVFYNNDNLPILYSVSCYDDKTLGLRLVQTWV
ncbi:MAG TPA: GntR family transcriptional regulator [Caldilineae bacterium]|nr:GntR family transcriptional regulator [Caldilineae bacterium]